MEICVFYVLEGSSYVYQQGCNVKCIIPGITVPSPALLCVIPLRGAHTGGIQPFTAAPTVSIRWQKNISFSISPVCICSSAFQEADIVSSKDSGHGDSEQGDSDHDATNRGQSSGKSDESRNPNCFFIPSVTRAAIPKYLLSYANPNVTSKWRTLSFMHVTPNGNTRV